MANKLLPVIGAGWLRAPGSGILWAAILSWVSP